MNHDYAHCIDYSPDCPADCFRARITEEAIKRNLTVSFMHLKGTDECKRGDKDADPED